MSWSWWGGAFNAGALQNHDKGVQHTRPAPRTSAANVSVTDERAMMVSTVFACVRLLVQSGATLPLGFYTRTADGREALDQDHQLCKLLKYRPNNFMTAKDFRAAMWTQRVLWGNAFAKIRWSAGKPVSLIPLKPEQMSVVRESNGLIYRYQTQQGTINYKQKDIFHLKGWSSDGITGLSALGYARETLGLSIAADQSASKSVSGRPNATLTVDEYPTQDQVETLRDLYGSDNGNAHYGADGQLMILPGGMKYNGISIPPDDLQLLESRQFQVPEICRFFGVPAVMVDGAAGSVSAWPASYEQQVLSFLTFTLKPYLEEWEDQTSATLLTPTEQRNVIIEHNVEGLLRTDSTSRAEFYASSLQNGWMTRAEVRQKENLPYIEGSDELTVQVNLTNIEDLPKANEVANHVE